MDLLRTAEQVFWYLGSAGAILVAVRLKASRLTGLYPFFFAFLLARVARSAALWNHSPEKQHYVFVWLITEPAVWILHILVVYEIQRRVLAGYPGVASLARWVLSAALLLAVVVSSLTLLPDLRSGVEDFPTLQLYNVVRRGIATILMLFLLLLSAFLIWFPVPLARNLVFHSLIFTFWSLSVTAGLFVRNLFGPGLIAPVSAAILGLNSLCMFLWLFLLNRKGEELKTVLLRPLAPGSEEQLLGQLTAINRSLARSGRK